MNDAERVEIRTNPGKVSRVYKGLTVRGANRMVRTWLFAVVVVLAAVAVGPGSGVAAVASERAIDAGPTGEENATNVSAGAAIAGAVGVGASDVEDDLESRSLAVRLATADNGTDRNASRASVVADGLARVDDRLDEMEREEATLRAEREAGNLSTSAFRVEMARLTAEAQSLRNQLARLETTAEDLPNATRTAYDIDGERFANLEGRSTNLTAGGRDRYVRTLVGNYSLVDWRSANGTLDDDAELRLAVERADVNRSMYRQQLGFLAEQVGDDRSEALDSALDCVDSRLSTADDRLDAAERALDDGRRATARSALREARSELDAAATCLEDARELLDEEAEGDDATPTGYDREYVTPTPSDYATPTEYDWDYNRTATPTR